MTWEITDTGVYRNGPYTVREAKGAPTIWKVFRDGLFEFSTDSAARVIAWVEARRTLEIRGDQIQRLVGDEPGMGHERDMRLERNARAEEQSK